MLLSIDGHWSFIRRMRDLSAFCLLIRPGTRSALELARVRTTADGAIADGCGAAEGSRPVTVVERRSDQRRFATATITWCARQQTLRAMSGAVCLPSSEPRATFGFSSFVREFPSLCRSSRNRSFVSWLDASWP
jgi:hypothetical protein